MEFISFTSTTTKACLSLINTLFSARIQGLFGLGFELTSIGFRLVL